MASAASARLTHDFAVAHHHRVRSQNDDSRRTAGKNVLRLFPSQPGSKADGVLVRPARLSNARDLDLKTIARLGQQFPPPRRARSKYQWVTHQLDLSHAGPRANALSGAHRPGHSWSVVGDPVAAIGTKQDHSAMTLEARVQVGNRILGGLFRA